MSRLAVNPDDPLEGFMSSTRVPPTNTELQDLPWKNSDLTSFLHCKVPLLTGGKLNGAVKSFWCQLSGGDITNIAYLAVRLALSIKEAEGGVAFLSDDYLKLPATLSDCSEHLALPDLNGTKEDLQTMTFPFENEHSTANAELDPKLKNKLAFATWFRSKSVEEIYLVTSYVALVCCRLGSKPVKSVGDFLTVKLYENITRFFSVTSGGSTTMEFSENGLSSIMASLGGNSKLHAIILSRALKLKELSQITGYTKTAKDAILSQAFLIHQYCKGNKLLHLFYKMASLHNGIGKVVERVYTPRTRNSLLAIEKFEKEYNNEASSATKSLWPWARCLSDNYITGLRGKLHQDLMAQLLAIDDHNHLSGQWKMEVMAGYSEERALKAISEQIAISEYLDTQEGLDIKTTVVRDRALKRVQEERDDDDRL